MNRRHFLQTTTGAATVLSSRVAAQPGATRPLVNAYYLRAHLYTMVPRHVREDLRWMADHGTNAVSVAVLEQDLKAAVENIALIGEEAEKLGLALYAVPSRWGGLLAGAPKVPSLFSVLNPQTWMLDARGKPYQSDTSGVISSVHSPETFEFFCRSVDEMARLWPIRGIVWDEPKQLGAKDFSPLALKNVPADAPTAAHVRAKTEFFSRVNAHVRRHHPKLTTSLFIYANSGAEVTNLAAQITDLDYFGCDGRPWAERLGGQMESQGKSLVDQGRRFVEVAKANGKKSLFLIENHNLPARDIDLMNRGLPEVLALKPDQLAYYYYPRNIGDPERNMATIARHLRTFK